MTAPTPRNERTREHINAVAKAIGWLQPSVIFQDTEVVLPTNRRADIVCVTASAKLAIIEVKTTWRASHLVAAWRKYGAWCHLLYLATSGEVDKDDPELSSKVLGSRTYAERVGIIHIGDPQLTVLRQAQYRHMPVAAYAIMCKHIIDHRHAHLVSKRESQEVLPALPGLNIELERNGPLAKSRTLH